MLPAWHARPRQLSARRWPWGAAVTRREAYVRGHQRAEMRQAPGLTRADLAEVLQVSQARISKIEHGEISGIDILRTYITALGGSIELVATLGERTWKVA